VAIALGLKAVQQRYRTLFTSAMSLIAALTKAYAENRLEERLKHDRLPKLLIIDEIGDIPIDQHGAHLFFQLISRRYERGSIVLTSNQSFGQWGEVFGNPIIAPAILDRLLHHSVVINIKGESYRLREKQKAGLLKKPEPSLGSSSRGGDFSSIVSGPFSGILDTRPNDRSWLGGGADSLQCSPSPPPGSPPQRRPGSGGARTHRGRPRSH
jgi:IstB-like ATP binding protein